MNPATKRVAGAVVQVLGRAQLLDPAAVHDSDPIAHRERLFLVVGHVHEGDPDLDLDPLQFELELAPEFEVECAERLVEEQHRGPIDERPGERHALLLAARQLVRLSALVAGQLHELECLADAIPRLGLGDALAAQPERHVVAHVEMREQRVVLEDHVHRALVGGVARNVPPAQLDPSPGRLFEPADHPQRRGLAAAARAEQREEFPGFDAKGDSVDRDDVPKPFLEVDEANLREGGFRETH